MIRQLRVHPSEHHLHRQDRRRDRTEVERIISARDGESVWSDSAFDSIDRKTLKKLPEEERKKKEVQLGVTAEKVMKDLLTDLEKTAQKNLQGERPAAAH